MNGDGLNITCKEFMSLPTRKQNAILFENTETIKKMISGYRYNQKIIIGWLSGITTVGAFVIVKFWETLGR